MSLKFLHLNIEAKKHLNQIISFLEKKDFDVLCLQEIFESDAEMLAKKFGMHLYMGKFLLRKGDAKAILSKIPFTKTKEHFLWGKDIRYHYSIEDFSLLEARIFHKGKEYVFFTTHLPVSYPGNIIVDYQLDCYKILKSILEKEENFIFTGDLNAPRGTFIFDDLASFLTDNIPKEIISTLDPVLHRTKGEFKFVVDGIFSRGNHKITNVVLHENLSDHKAISGQLN